MTISELMQVGVMVTTLAATTDDALGWFGAGDESDHERIVRLAEKKDWSAHDLAVAAAVVHSQRDRRGSGNPYETAMEEFYQLATLGDWELYCDHIEERRDGVVNDPHGLAIAEAICRRNPANAVERARTPPGAANGQPGVEHRPAPAPTAYALPAGKSNPSAQMLELLLDLGAELDTLKRRLDARQPDAASQPYPAVDRHCPLPPVGDSAARDRYRACMRERLRGWLPQ